MLHNQLEKSDGIRMIWFLSERGVAKAERCWCIFHLKAKEELTDWVTDADALLSTRATPQLINDDQGSVTRIVDYVRDLKTNNKAF